NSRPKAIVSRTVSRAVYAPVPSSAPNSALFTEFNELGSPLTEVAQYPGGHFASSAANQFASRLPQITQPIPGCLPAAAAAQFMTRGSSVSGYPGRNNTTTVARKGGRRPREAEEEESMDLTEDDLQKRQKRRQRNKEAAARCRKRRLDLMTTLSDQVEQLKGQNRNLQVQVDALMQEKNKLVELLRNHDCHASKELRDALVTSNNNSSHMGQFNDMQHQPYMVPLKHSPPSVHDSGDELGKAEEYKQGDYPPVSGALDMPFTATSNNPLLNDPVISSASYDEPLQKRLKSEETPDENNSRANRPTSLFGGFAPMRQGVGNTPGFPSFTTPNAVFEASTPSTGLDHNFGALGNGPTFLTPVASGPTLVTPSNPPQSNDIQSL
ncbi:bZIP transcription factor family protein, partial [Aphelenchoides avenae]